MLIDFTNQELVLINFFYSIMEKYNKKQTIYLCGGFVRDKILKIIPKDIDLIAHSSIFPELKSEIYKANKNFNFSKITEKNKIYGSLKNVKMLQFFYHGKKIDIKIFEKTLYEDLKERDFTINSLYYNIWDNGINDLINVF